MPARCWARACERTVCGDGNWPCRWKNDECWTSKFASVGTIESVNETDAVVWLVDVVSDAHAEKIFLRAKLVISIRATYLRAWELGQENS